MYSDTFRQELTDLLNRHSMENNSNTPDFLLAEYIVDCLRAFDMAVSQRSKWMGFDQSAQHPLQPTVPHEYMLGAGH